MNPLLSIITVNLNNAEGLEQTIRSVITQPYQPIQHVVIDGGSADGSKAVIENFADHIYYSLSEKDDGIYSGMNKGIAHSTGEYLLFLNSGDVLINNNPLQNLIDNGSNAEIIYGNIKMTDRSNSKEVIFPDNLSFKFFYINSLPHSCTLIRRKLFDTGLYREDFKVASDWAFFILAICKHNCSYRHVDTTVANFQLGGISTTHPEVIEQEREIIMNKHFPAFVRDYKKMWEIEEQLTDVKKQLGFRLHRKFKKVFFNGR